jgi:adenosylmethionine-8-amino-7-oxononanoate aminotransferase
MSRSQPQEANARVGDGMSALLQRNLRESPPVATAGEGVYLFDSDGRRYLDASGGAAVSSLGHGHPAVVDAIERQLHRLEYAHTSFFTSVPAEMLAEKLLSGLPTFGAGRVALVGDGSEATEAALKLARQHFVEKGEATRFRFIARRLSYHGNTLGALAVGGHELRRAIYRPLLTDASFISPCYAYRYKHECENDAAYAKRLSEELAEEIERLGPTTVAALILEPIVGATSGAVPPVAGYLGLMREVCDRYGVLMICDEVMCGMGRCGTFFVSEEEGIVPDIITIAKGLAAGYQPIGGVIARESVIAPLAAGTGLLAHGHTYMSHPVACAAALAVYETIVASKLLESVVRTGRILEARLRERFGDHPYIGDIRGRGLLWALELVSDRSTRAPFSASYGLAGKIKRAAQQAGLLCYPASGTADGESGDHVLLAPPFIITPQQVDEMIELLAAAIQSVLTSVLSN